jgi:hypothetical protein
VGTWQNRPTEFALQNRVRELEGIIQPLLDELRELYGQHGYGGESLPMINARLAITPPAKEDGDE